MSAEVIFILIGIGVFVLVLFMFYKMAFIHRDIREEFSKRDSYYDLSKINKNKPLKKKIGKLVKKKVDKPAVWRRGYSYTRRLGIEPFSDNPDFYNRYYLTFETFDGYTSFTVSKKEFSKYRTGTYGYIYYQKSRFSHFEIRNREDLHIDEMIDDKKGDGSYYR